jgi:hypothetical protein
LVGHALTVGDVQIGEDLAAAGGDALLAPLRHVEHVQHAGLVERAAVHDHAPGGELVLRRQLVVLEELDEQRQRQRGGRVRGEHRLLGQQITEAPVVRLAHAALRGQLLHLRGAELELHELEAAVREELVGEAREAARHHHARGGAGELLGQVALHELLEVSALVQPEQQHDAGRRGGAGRCGGQPRAGRIITASAERGDRYAHPSASSSSLPRRWKCSSIW